MNNINHMDEVWAVSENAAKDLVEFGYKGKYRVMRNGTDYEKGGLLTTRLRKSTAYSA